MREHIYRVQGMHCASCEVLIEKKLLEIKNIKSAEASTARSEALIEYEGERPALGKLNEIFRKDGYVFSNLPDGARTATMMKKELFIAFGAGLLVVVGFIGLNKLGLSGLVNVGSQSSLPMFFALGLVAGISSCAALVGGIILSMSKQWGELYAGAGSFGKKFQPHLLFNAGRLVSYAIFGAAMGAIGNRLNFSLKSGPILVIAVSALMILLALQMLGLRAFRRIQFTMPKFITRFIADESNFKGRHMPLVMGALTFFLPCGFTVTAQGLALLSGDAMRGGLIMLLFALGTLPTLLFIGLSGAKLANSARLSAGFLKAAGVVVLFFALYNINFQLNILGFPSFSDLGINSSQAASANGLQVIKMDASARGYVPNYFKVKAGMPVRWEITDKGTSGCTNAIISKNLFDGEIPLTPGRTSVKEFTPSRPGRYKFSCWMGMVSGIVEVVE